MMDPEGALRLAARPCYTGCMRKQQTQHTTQESDASAATVQFSPRTPRQLFVKELTARLGETEDAVLAQLDRVVWKIGRTQAYALYQETLEIEERGGMLVPDGSRRTPGGVFFYLARTKGVKKDRPWLRERRGGKDAHPAATPQAGHQAEASST
jgi:PHAX RNA-binding domain